MPLKILGKTMKWLGKNVIGNLTGRNEASRYQRFADDRAYDYALNQHAYTVEDMKRAGLNPLLAAGATNSMPQHGSLPVGSDDLTSLASMGKLPVEVYKSLAEAEMLKAQAGNLNVDTTGKLQQVEFFDRIKHLKVAEISQALQTGAINIESMRANIQKTRAEIDKIGNDVRRENEMHDLQTDLIKQQIALAKHDYRTISKGNLPSGAVNNLLGTAYTIANSSGRKRMEGILDFLWKRAEISAKSTKQSQAILEKVFGEMTNTLIEFIDPRNSVMMKNYPELREKADNVIKRLRAIDNAHRDQLYGGNRR